MCFPCQFSPKQDLALEFYIVAESFETSVPWDKCAQLCRNTKLRVSKVCITMHRDDSSIDIKKIDFFD